MNSTNNALLLLSRERQRAVLEVLHQQRQVAQMLLALSALALPAAKAQTPPGGMASDRPFNAKFVNIAEKAGLHAPTIYGDENRADYIQESIGCGVAFIDYDNDGWQDIVVLTGKRRTGPTPTSATIRLYHNNRDGTFKDI